MSDLADYPKIKWSETDSRQRRHAELRLSPIHCIVVILKAIFRIVKWSVGIVRFFWTIGSYTWLIFLGKDHCSIILNVIPELFYLLLKNNKI